MAKIGSMELIVILIVAMLAIGPERMPKAARTLGKAVGSFKKYMNDATSDLREASDEFREVTDEIADAQKTVRKAFKDADDEISKTRGEAEEKLNPKKKKKKPAAPETDETDEAPKPPKDEAKAEAAEPQGEDETEAQPERPRKNTMKQRTSSRALPPNKGGTFLWVRLERPNCWLCLRLCWLSLGRRRCRSWGARWARRWAASARA